LIPDVTVGEVLEIEVTPEDFSEFGRIAAQTAKQLMTQRLREAETERRLLFFAVGVQGANTEILSQIALPERPPIMLNGLDFRSLFVWLSTSMKRVSSGKIGDAISLPPVGWGQITS